jgi:hypothetical protein
MKLLVKLLSIPLESLSIAVLNMNHYPTLMKYMKFTQMKTVALRIVKAVINDRQHLSSQKTVDQLIDFTMPLLVDDKESADEEPYEFEEGQEAVAKMLHLIYHKTNSDIYYELLMKLKRVFVKGGTKRMKYTIPALIFSLLKLSIELLNRTSAPELEDEGKENDDEPQVKLPKVDQNKIFKVIHELIQLIQSYYPDLSLRLYLQATETINRNPNWQELEELAYEFVSQSMIIYQEELSDSEAKF